MTIKRATDIAVIRCGKDCDGAHVVFLHRGTEIAVADLDRRDALKLAAEIIDMVSDVEVGKAA
jgi:hypothetical protein